MSIFAICSSNDEERFKSNLLASCNGIGIPCINVKDDEKSQIPCTLEQKYNAAIKNLTQQVALKDDDVVLFAKDTINFIDKEIKDKILVIFESPEYKNVAILGVCGLLSMHKKPFLMNESVGQLMIPTPSDPSCGDVLEFQHVGFFTNILTVLDNVFAVRAKVLKQNYIFDDVLFKNNPFYLLDLCVRLCRDNYKIAVSQILVFDSSKDVFNDPPSDQVFNCENYKSHETVFLDKHKMSFPITINSLDTEKILINLSDL